MPKFDLSQYETVETRINRFYEMHPDGRIITEDLTTDADRQNKVWRVKTTIYLTDGDQAAGLPKATGHAFEIDGQGMANQQAALENCETSSIGRALANMNLSGSKRPSREEMEKATRVANKADWLLEASKLDSVDGLRRLYIKAQKQGATKDELAEIKKKADDLTTGSVSQGAGGSLPSVEKSGAK